MTRYSPGEAERRRSLARIISVRSSTGRISQGPSGRRMMRQQLDGLVEIAGSRSSSPRGAPWSRRRAVGPRDLAVAQRRVTAVWGLEPLAPASGRSCGALVIAKHASIRAFCSPPIASPSLDVQVPEADELHGRFLLLS